MLFSVALPKTKDNNDADTTWPAFSFGQHDSSGYDAILIEAPAQKTEGEYSPETTVRLIFKFYFLLVPNGLERSHGGAPRLCVSPVRVCELLSASGRHAGLIHFGSNREPHVQAGPWPQRLVCRSRQPHRDYATSSERKWHELLTMLKRKAPGSFLPRACVQTSMITRSGIEVAMDAEAERPVVLVFRGSKTTAHQGRAVVDNQCRGALKLTVPAPKLALCILEYITSRPM